jgi:TPR repeat protein
MIQELPQLLRKVPSGDASVLKTLLDYFKEQKLSNEEREQVHLYLKEAVRQSHHAVYFLALLYDNGYGVKQNLDMAFVLMREAAAKGNSLAIYEVGHRFLIGTGVEPNYESALQWLNTAAGSPYYVADAMYDLGLMYEKGLGVAHGLLLAKDWYNKAAQKGSEKAKEKLLSQWPSTDFRPLA